MGQARGQDNVYLALLFSLLPSAQPKIILIPALGQIGMIHKPPSGSHLYSNYVERSFKKNIKEKNGLFSSYAGESLPSFAAG